MRAEKVSSGGGYTGLLNFLIVSNERLRQTTKGLSQSPDHKEAQDSQHTAAAPMLRTFVETQTWPSDERKAFGNEALEPIAKSLCGRLDQPHPHSLHASERAIPSLQD